MNPDSVNTGNPLISMVALAVVILYVAALWRVFAKAGEPGWACLVPIYNVLVLLRIIGKPAWWILLMIVPLVNIVIAIIEHVELAKAFGKGGGFAAGLIFLPFIFYPILAWGDAQYQRGAASPAGAAFA
jgi:Family of unknown function (DUF5684)